MTKVCATLIAWARANHETHAGQYGHEGAFETCPYVVCAGMRKTRNSSGRARRREIDDSMRRDAQGSQDS